MFETKTPLVWLSIILLLPATSGIYQTHTENKVGHHSEIKNQRPCEKGHKKFCLYGGECYYLADEGIVGCKRSWWFGGKRCERYMWWNLRIKKMINFYFKI